jgi:hypothetical protein
MRVLAMACLLSTAALLPRALAQTPPAPAAKPCATAEYRQFDFWLGDWNVKNAAGKDVGTNHLVSLHGGCAMQESWASPSGVTGSSLSGWDSSRKQWHQTWMDNGGNVLQLDGALADGKMVLAGDTNDPRTGSTTRNRVTWIPLADGRVRQWWEQSADGGKTWTTAFDGYYSRQ